jgi:hypothetical protein
MLSCLVNEGMNNIFHIILTGGYTLCSTPSTNQYCQLQPTKWQLYNKLTPDMNHHLIHTVPRMRKIW